MQIMNNLVFLQNRTKPELLFETQGEGGGRVLDRSKTAGARWRWDWYIGFLVIETMIGDDS